jgi:hypothetical protein
LGDRSAQQAEKVTIDKSRAYTAAINRYDADHKTDIERHQCVREQQCRTGPPSDQAPCSADAGFQVHAQRAGPAEGYRDDAHDRNGLLASLDRPVASAAEQFDALAY